MKEKFDCQLQLNKKCNYADEDIPIKIDIKSRNKELNNFKSVMTDQVNTIKKLSDQINDPRLVTKG